MTQEEEQENELICTHTHMLLIDRRGHMLGKIDEQVGSLIKLLHREVVTDFRHAHKEEVFNVVRTLFELFDLDW